MVTLEYATYQGGTMIPAVRNDSKTVEGRYNENQAWYQTGVMVW